MATCVGEEGLDIGEVDLIVCFDAHASPIRLVQRMGRTGRKRDGRIVILVTEGKEEQVHTTVRCMLLGLSLKFEILPSESLGSLRIRNEMEWSVRARKARTSRCCNSHPVVTRGLL